ncbi:YlbE-like family protein [Salipaludibacillus daqingensis]|uniref:YlbE-like family protein n=1 Tax=Salipaludibacillus daqingensis TaxID=3041001 RepID=UPI002473D948|nr:YlbE-like family protein [Salipaludibacillus daqingensis]
MRKEVYDWIRSSPELHHYLRMNPIWYRKLGREPELLEKMIQESKVYFGKTFTQRIDQIHNNMNMAMMVIEMMRQMNES